MLAERTKFGAKLVLPIPQPVWHNCTMAPVDHEAHTPLPVSQGTLVRRLQEQVSSLQAQVDDLQRAYPVVAGMTPSQRKGVIAGTGGAIVAVVAILPQVIEALQPMFVALGWAK